MAITRHASKRMQQRGINKNQIELIVDHGKLSMAPGGAWICQLPKKTAAQLIAEHKRQIRMIERCSNKTILLSADFDSVITCYNLR